MLSCNCTQASLRIDAFTLKHNQCKVACIAAFQSKCLCCRAYSEMPLQCYACCFHSTSTQNKMNSNSSKASCVVLNLQFMMCASCLPSFSCDFGPNQCQFDCAHCFPNKAELQAATDDYTAQGCTTSMIVAVQCWGPQCGPSMQMTYEPFTTRVDAIGVGSAHALPSSSHLQGPVHLLAVPSQTPSQCLVVCKFPPALIRHKPLDLCRTSSLT